MEDVPHEVAVADEPGDVVRQEDLLAELTSQFNTHLDQLRLDALGRDELQELLHRRRVVEVVADDAAVQGDALVDDADGNR